MAGGTFSRSSSQRSNSKLRDESAKAELPAAYRGAFNADPAEDQRLWDAYQRSHSLADRQALILHFLPAVTIAATQRARRKRDEDFDQLISDGTDALVEVIDRPRYRFTVAPFRIVWHVIKTAMWQYPIERRWGKYPRTVRSNLISAFRKRFINAHGRPPREGR